MFKTRLLSGIVLVAVLILTVGMGGPVLYTVLLAASLIGLMELYRTVKVQNQALGVVGYLGAIGYYILMYQNKMEYIMPLIILVLMLAMAVYVFAYPKFVAEQVMTVFFGVLYVAVMLSFVYQTRCLPDGMVMVWLIFLSSWGCDTCAYCVGMLIGKHKMSPKLSPKKSVEGAIGGVVGAALLTVIYGMIFKNAMGVTTQHVWIMAAISAVGALISMVGDLTASAIKRNYEIKDYGKLIPGHGGILDRFDSVIFTAPMIYFLAANFIVL